MGGWQSDQTGLEALHALAARALTPQSPYEPASKYQDPLRLLPGQLLPDLPAAIPLPEGSHLLGSVLAGPGEGTIFLDVPRSPEQVHELFRAHLARAGWREADEEAGDVDAEDDHGGFTLAAGWFAGGQAGARWEAGGHALTVVAREWQPGLVDVRLQVRAQPEVAREQRRSWRRARHMRPDSHVPTLRPPRGAEQRPMGGSHGGDSEEITALLGTSLDLPAVAAHYAAQLERAGWTRTLAARDGPLAWSIWTFLEDEEPFRGVFAALWRPWAAGQYRLEVQVERAGAVGAAGTHEGMVVSHSVSSRAWPSIW